jgi:hypothetical protein
MGQRDVVCYSFRLANLAAFRDPAWPFRSEHNAADAMTKMAQNVARQEILHPHRVSHPLEQYVIDTRLFSDNCTGK